MSIQSKPKPVKSRTIKFGDTVYLQHMSGNYLTAVGRGRYSWPKLGQTKQVELQILGNTEEELTDGAIVKLKSTESELGDRNILGAFADSHDCYYWNDGYDDRKQGWQIKKKDNKGDRQIRYGDEVYFTNLYYKNQRLARCSWYEGYITTFPQANEWWTLKAEVTDNESNLSSEGAFLQTVFEPNAKGFSVGNMAYLAYCAEAVYSKPEESKAKLEQLGFQINGHEHFLNFPDTDTQCIAVGDEDKIIIAFRGTENLHDWQTNIKLLKAAWKVGMVHAGFYTSLQSVWPHAIKRLEQLRTNNQPIWLTGHSLGGALATLACATLEDELPDYEIAGVYTFGQPRVGDFVFAQALEQKNKERIFRVVNNNDLVPRIPRIKYHHVGKLLYFDADGNLYDDMILSWLSFRAIGNRLKGYYKSLFNLDSDDIGDHRMGDYRILTMRQLS